ncbi:hypothetical protein HRI_004277900 [Hibiscus trionum]|uniref:Uncharacterized protein n=1 Tax=Hibiscus trionum TaxID=183268 RepID=A0A9W7MML8_HIBTR|nr:hypothetical protein HRI_004277900 [Hibiscus trionum]
MILTMVRENVRHCGLFPELLIKRAAILSSFDCYHRRKEISKELYEFCLDQGHADCRPQSYCKVEEAGI